MSNEGEQALFAAIDGGDLETVRAMIKGDTTLAAARDPAGVSASLHARYRGQSDIAEALFAAAPDPDVFECAAAGSVAGVARCLDAAPTEAKAFSADGFTALHLAAFFNRPDVAALLIARGADVNAIARNPMQVRPLHSAATMRASAVVTALLAHGADPNAPQEQGATVLMSAAASGDAESVKALRAHGADVDARGPDGKCALDHARERGRAEIVVLLSGLPR